ncbi:MAG: hypothetical protein HQK56_19945 [Deltaproteobacteria bacterium]|nr:hypothetical protein [Deltaproteobacteria bacterium]
MDTWRTEWAQRKNEIALKLNARECGGSYGDAAIILSATLSALAAEVWPGDYIDRVRFVQLLKDFAPDYLNVTRVSIPLLERRLRVQLLNDFAPNHRNVTRVTIPHLERFLRIKKYNALGPGCHGQPSLPSETCLRIRKRYEKGEAIRKIFPKCNSDEILWGDEVDKSESEIQGECQKLNLKELRDHSYANLLYKEIRCGYVHEGRTGERADSWPMTERIDVISYSNYDDDPERRIHFPISWMSKLALSVAEGVDRAASSGLPKEQPKQWWVNGLTDYNT